MKVAFAGTAEFAVPSLRELNKHHQIVAVYSQPDKKQGRGQTIKVSPIKQFATKNHLPIHQPININEKKQIDLIKSQKPDVIVVSAFGQLLSKELLTLPPYGCINVHASLLPLWRGAAPIQRSIEAGDKRTGVSIMQMSEGLDNGPYFQQKSITIGNLNAQQLHDKLSELGAKLLLETLENINTIITTKQNESKATYAPKLNKAEGLIDWHQSNETLYNKIRAFNPYPVCFTTIFGQKVRIFEAKTSPKPQHKAIGEAYINDKKLFINTPDGALEILILQPEGRKKITAKDYLNGLKNK